MVRKSDGVDIESSRGTLNDNGNIPVGGRSASSSNKSGDQILGMSEGNLQVLALTRIMPERAQIVHDEVQWYLSELEAGSQALIYAICRNA